MMMQMSDAHNQKNSLFNAMNRFIGAVNNMDQTIMVPSLLRDVPLDEDRDLSAMKSAMDEGDMFSYYELLKSIRSNMEWGVRCAASSAPSPSAADEQYPGAVTIARMNSTTSTYSMSSSASTSSYEEEEEESEEEEDLEKQFQFHLTGLQDVLSKLTVQANCLTRHYKKEVGIGGWGQ